MMTAQSYGWICLKCGAGYAPWQSYCPPCVIPKTSTGVSTTVLPGYGTVFSAPYRSPEQLAAERAALAAQPSYAEVTANQIIKDWQSNGEMKIERLRELIISALQDYDE